MRRLLVGAAAALAVLACAWWIWTASLEREVARRILALRRAGLPTDRHCFTQAPIPPGEDAAPLYAEFAAWCDEHPVPPWFDDTAENPEELDRIRAWLDEARPALETLRCATERPACSHPGDASVSPVSWDMPLFGIAVDVSSLVEDEVRVALHDGDGYAQALAATRILWDLARHVDDRQLAGALVRSTSEVTACERLRELAVTGQLGLPALRELVSGWRRRGPGRTIEEVLAGERAMVLDALLSGELPDVGAVESRLWSSAIARPLILMHVLRQLDGFARGMTLAARRDPRGLPALLAEGRARRRRSWCEPFTPCGTWFAAAFSHERFRRAAWLNVTATGLDLLAWREAHGAWPDTLDAFPDATDPFTGEALVHERTETGVRVAARDPEPDADDPLEWRLPG